MRIDTTFVNKNIAKSTYNYTKVFMMADIQQRDDNVHIENDEEGSADESEEEDRKMN